MTHLIRSSVLFGSLVFVTACVFPLESLAAKTCQMQLDHSSLVVQWTAFKTNQKTAVPGTFAKVKLSGKTQAKTLTKLLEQLSVEIPIQNAASIQTTNPARDKTLYDHFFKHIKGPIKASLKKVTELPGTFDLQLKLNQKTRTVPFTYLVKDGALTAQGSIDVFDFALATAFEDLHRACEVLHTGTDGVSKTWSTVELKIQANVKENCK